MHDENIKPYATEFFNTKLEFPTTAKVTISYDHSV